MGLTVNLEAFQKLVAEDIGWLMKQPRTLERDHILGILQAAPGIFYDKLHCRQGRCGMDCLCWCERCMAAKYWANYKNKACGVCPPCLKSEPSLCELFVAPDDPVHTVTDR